MVVRLAEVGREYGALAGLEFIPDINKEYRYNEICVLSCCHLCAAIAASPARMSQLERARRGGAHRAVYHTATPADCGC